MLDRLTGKPVHLYLHLFCCSLLAAGLPASKIPLSLATMLGVLNLLLKADFRSYWNQLRTNRLAWGLWLYLAVLLLSLGWTSDWAYASHDLRVKLPLIAIPLLLICYPIEKRKHLLWLLGLFIASLFVTSLINIGAYWHWWGNTTYDDIRGLSLFASHIRYALMIVMGIALCITWILARLPYRIIPLLLAIWWIAYTNYSQVLSGYLALGAVAAVTFIWFLREIRKTWLKAAISLTAVGCIVTAILVVVNIMEPVPHKVVMHNLPKYTEAGGWYWHDTIDPHWENGYPVIAFINEEELSTGWNAASEVDYYTGTDRKRRPLHYTLWLYMTSKGLHKDSAGFSKMTAKDVTNVEAGYTSVLLTKTGFRARLNGMKHQLEHPENPNGHSLLQRLEYWKAGTAIIRGHWLTGVGFGDVDNAFKTHYATSGTLLEKEMQLRAHNQYMTSWISAGIAGLIAFLLWWIGFFRAAWKQHRYAALCFSAIAICSFLVEDTLETQVGITFVAFFYGLFAGYFQINPRVTKS